MPDMHNSLARMLRIAHEATVSSARPIQTLSQLRDRLDVSPQVMNHWKSRGVSKVGAILAAKEFNCSVASILEDPTDDVASTPTKEGAALRVQVAQNLSYRPAILAPLYSWEQLVNNKQDLPADFVTVLIDDAMAPKAPAGSRVRFKRDSKAMPGDAVLVVDSAGETYFRLFIGGLHGRWQAAPTNHVYPTLDATEHGLRILAVFAGIEGSWSQLAR